MVELLYTNVLSKYNQLNGKFEEASFELAVQFLVNCCKFSNANKLNLEGIKPELIDHVMKKGTNKQKYVISALLLNLSIIIDEKETDLLLRLSSLIAQFMDGNETLELNSLSFLSVCIGTLFYKLQENGSSQSNPLLPIDLTIFSRFDKLLTIYAELATIFNKN